ncbi:hypothetical protein [Deinococcus fonticola]|uniref:hypothetical protein n=1 Tax=Deinococcus fonticola TaxID=2528713 RepID=UPI001074D33C|nr:hypothetical protein [Deinococcus fonticola]
MTLQTQVKVFSADLASFGGVRLRRVSVLVGGQPRQMLLHELGRAGAFVMSGAAGADGAAAYAGELLVKAEWGEPLGSVTELHSDPVSGEVQGYTVQLRVKGQHPVTVHLAADATFWWNGELCCTKRAAYHLRDIGRGRRDPRSPLPPAPARGRVRASAA